MASMSAVVVPATTAPVFASPGIGDGEEVADGVGEVADGGDGVRDAVGNCVDGTDGVWDGVGDAADVTDGVGERGGTVGRGVSGVGLGVAGHPFNALSTALTISVGELRGAAWAPRQTHRYLLSPQNDFKHRDQIFLGDHSVATAVADASDRCRRRGTVRDGWTRCHTRRCLGRR